MSLGRRVAVSVVVLTVLSCFSVSSSSAISAPSAATVSASKGHYSATIRRTQYGIPHILASNYGDLGFGYGYAFAQDNICALADEVLTVSGTRSEFFGPDTESGDQLNGPMPNLDSDIYYRSINASGVIEKALRQPAPLGPTPQVTQLIAGYVAGIDNYLADTGVANLPDPTCRAKPWVRPVTALDIERIMYNLVQVNGTEAAIPLIAQASPGQASNQTITMSGLGSNAIAVGRDDTQDGDGELLANPHYPWVGATRFYQVQLTIPGQLNVSGASVYGTPVVEIGHTTSLAWTHTVSTAQRYTLYQLALVPGDPTSYMVDGHAEAMTRQTIEVPVLTASGSVSTVTRTLYSSRYGPLLALDWTATTALAMKGVNAGNVRAMSEWLAIDGANSVAQLRTVQNHFQGLPFVNTIASDSNGTAYVSDASVVPDVTNAEAARCVTPLGKTRYPRQIILDGSTSACGWGSDPSAVEPGIFGPSTDPTLVRTDYVTNSNNSLWLSNPTAPLTGYPSIYGDVGTPRTLRTRMGIDLINGRLQGTDGLGAPGFSLGTLQQAELSDRNYSAELARDGAVALCQAHPVLTASNGQSIDVSGACPVLAAWNLRDDPDSKGAVLWRAFWLEAQNAPDLWSLPFNPADPAATPNTLNTASAQVATALADAVRHLNAAGVPLDAMLSTAQQTTVGGSPIAVPGCLDQEGCYNVVQNTAATALGANGQFPPVTFGSSFVMVVDLGSAGPTAWTILTYSESSDPTSPHHADQTALFAQKGWVADRFTEAQISSDPDLQVTTVSGR